MPDDAEERLEKIPRQFRGFAYEGAGMGFAVRDALRSAGVAATRGSSRAPAASTTT